ncbi:MAG: methylmalonyl-CoA epimerase [Myxococcales bacterium]|nr:methylmalonyl-CoA epimerase [Myxococcales bacterium]
MVPKPFFKKIDHLGIAVPSMAEALPVYEALFGVPASHLEDVPDQKVRTAFFPVGESHFELLEAMAEDSPIARYLEKRRGGIHHVCVEVNDLDGLLAEYKARGVRLIDAEARPGAHGKRVAFVHPAATGGVLLELSEDAKGLK